ncbi:MAG: DUF4440 domain-containing protein [Alteromonadaceae bacterium]|nr:DUF4440 domain-containing protein [Alteromonadaceae bacterium]
MTHVIIEQEQALFANDTRKSRAELERLLHPEFIEIGASGRRFNREQIIAELSQEQNENTSIVGQRFAEEGISDNAKLLTYELFVEDIEGHKSQHSRRSSLWVKTSTGWQIKFHQGTPCEAFPSM